MVFEDCLTHASTPIENDQPVKKYALYTLTLKEGRTRSYLFRAARHFHRLIIDFCPSVGLGPILWPDLGSEYTNSSISRNFRSNLPWKESFWLVKANFVPRVSSKMSYCDLWNFFGRFIGLWPLKSTSFIFPDLYFGYSCSKSFEKL